MTIINYYTSVGAGAAVATSREISVGKLNPVVNLNLNANVNANAELVFINPGYTFATPVLGGQLFLGAFSAVGRISTEVNGTISAGVAGFTATRQGSISDTTAGFGDIYPQAMLRWNNGVNNWIVYATGDIPVGTYASTNLSNLGLGHGAVDAGGGYTYLNPQTGHEITAVTGFTYNLINPSTNYQSGVDWHLDWGASQFLTKQLLVGAVGYFYEQVSADSGSGDRVGALRVRRDGSRPANRLHHSGRSHAGLRQCQGVLGIRRTRPAVRLERVADLVTATKRAGQSAIRDADQVMMSAVA